jgi:hypothetical protein
VSPKRIMYLSHNVCPYWRGKHLHNHYHTWGKWGRGKNI